jgi:hypothetical protein
MSQTKAQLIDNLVSPITGALGSASAPTFSFTSDPNTGIYSPVADQVAISTNGQGRLFIDATGNIKTAWVNDAFLGTYFDATYYQGFTFGTSARILYIDNLANDTRADIVFRNGAAGTLSEKLRITAAGLVGIGTSSPGNTLDTAGAVDFRTIGNQTFDAGNKATCNVGNYTTYNTSCGSLFTLGIQNTSAMNAGAVFRYTFGLAGNANGQDLTFSSVVTTGTVAERLRIDSSGRLLVGTSSTGSVNTKSIEIHNAGTATNQPAFQVYSYPGASAVDVGYFNFFKSRGSSVGTTHLLPVVIVLG